MLRKLQFAALIFITSLIGGSATRQQDREPPMPYIVKAVPIIQVQAKRSGKPTDPIPGFRFEVRHYETSELIGDPYPTREAADKACEQLNQRERG